MYSITYEEMENLKGGDVTHYIDAGCAAVGAYAFFIGPVGWTVGGFCAGWGVGRALNGLFGGGG